MQVSGLANAFMRLTTCPLNPNPKAVTSIKQNGPGIVP
jgi:hypothetical protein